MTEARPNPYNRDKSWQEGDEPEFVDSDSLFRPTRQKDPEDISANLEDKDDPYKTRYDELKRHHDSRIRDFKQEIDQLKAEVQARGNTYTPPKTEEEIEAFKEENPELYAVVESKIYNDTRGTTQKLEELEAKERKILKREAGAYLKSVHSDIEDIKVDPAFHNWAEDQPESIQDWIYKNPYDGVLAAKAITLYKTEKGIGEAEDNTQPEVEEEDNSTLLPTRHSGANTTPEKKIWTTSEIDRMDMRTYDRYESEILLAEEEGRIVPG